MHTRQAVLLLTLALLLSACGSAPKAELVSASYVETINAGGVFYKYEGKDNVEIVLDFSFDESLVAGLDTAAEDFRDQVYDILVEGAHFYYLDQEVDRTYGYWPVEAGADYAKEMTLFYVVPSGHASGSLKFVYDGAVLGEGGKGIDQVIQP